MTSFILKRDEHYINSNYKVYEASLDFSKIELELVKNIRKYVKTNLSKIISYNFLLRKDISENL